MSLVGGAFQSDVELFSAYPFNSTLDKRHFSRHPRLDWTRLAKITTCTIQKCNSVRVVFAKFGFGMFNQVAKQLKNRILELKAIDFRLKCQRHTADN